MGLSAIRSDRHWRPQRLLSYGLTSGPWTLILAVNNVISFFERTSFVRESPRTLTLALCFLTTIASLPGQTAEQRPSDKPKEKAEEFEDFDELSLGDLLDVPVSIASGRSQSLEQAPAVVSVVTAEDIRHLGLRTLEDALEIVPGFEVLTDSVGRDVIIVRGLKESVSGPFAVSSAAASVLILFNGHRLNSNLDGGSTGVNLDIPLYNVYKIEIIRGPGSALFGSNAFVGVINILTYTSENFDGIEANVEAGSYETQEYSVVAARTFGNVGLSGSFQFFDRNGPSLFVPADAQTTFDDVLSPIGVPRASLAPGFADDSRRAFDWNFHAAYRGLSIVGRVHDETSGGFIGELDSLGDDNEVRTRQTLLGANQAFSISDRLKGNARFSFVQSEFGESTKIRPDGFFCSPVFNCDGFGLLEEGIEVEGTVNSRRYQGEVSFDYALFDSNRLTVGTSVEYENTYGLSFALNEEAEPLFSPQPSLEDGPSESPPDTSFSPDRKLFSLFAQDTWDIVPQVGLTLGLRWDDYDDLDGSLNPRAAVVWRMPRKFHLKILYGSAFRPPTLLEKFIAVRQFLVGNANLKPATIDTFEAALTYRASNISVSTNFYWNSIKDLIVTRVPEDLDFGLFGIGTFDQDVGEKLTTRGVETEIKGTFGLNYSFFANYTYQRPEDQDGQRLPDVPSHLANFGANIGIGKHVIVSPVVRVRSSRPRDSLEAAALERFPTLAPRFDPVDGYAIVDLNLHVINIGDSIEVRLNIQNVFDTEYFDPAPPRGFPGDYPRPGRSAFFRFSFKY